MGEMDIKATGIVDGVHEIEVKYDVSIAMCTNITALNVAGHDGRRSPNQR